MRESSNSLHPRFSRAARTATALLAQGDPVALPEARPVEPPFDARTGRYLTLAEVAQRDLDPNGPREPAVRWGRDHGWSAWWRDLAQVFAPAPVMRERSGRRG